MGKQLSAAFVNSVKDAGKYFDGGGLGLCLRVDDTGYKRWVQRIRINGRQRDLGQTAQHLSYGLKFVHGWSLFSVGKPVDKGRALHLCPVLTG